MILCGIKLREINDVSLANSSYSTTEVQSVHDRSAEGETACVERERQTGTFHLCLLLCSCFSLSVSSICFPLFSVLVICNWGLDAQSSL